MSSEESRPPGASDPYSVSQSERLDSWKEIAAYLKRDVSTVQRWEKNAGLPVHRIGNNKHGTIYALRSELDAWLANGRAIENGAAARFRWGRLLIALSLSVPLLGGFYFLVLEPAVMGRAVLTVRKVFDGYHAYILSGPSPPVQGPESRTHPVTEQTD